MSKRYLLLALCACALACDSASPVAPSGAVLSAIASPTQIDLTGQSTITVTGFKPDATPLNPGTQIILSTSLGNLFHPTTGAQISIVEIDGNGRAVAMLRADGRSGAATVTATLTTSGGGGGGGGGGDGDGDGGGGGATVGASASVSVQIGQVDTDRPTLVISANPTIVDVLEVSRIDILGRNSDNTPVSAGQRIRLTSNLGTLHATADAGDTVVVSSVDTNSTGEGIVYFRAGEQAGTGVVSAILGTSDEVSIDLDIRDEAKDIIFTPTPTQVASAGGEIQFVATVVNARGDGVRNILVIFDTSRINVDGGVGGTFAPGGSVLTDDSGIARATLTLTQTDLTGIAEFDATATATIEGNGITRTARITVQ